MKAELSQDGTTIIITIPMNLRKRGGRKRIMAPDGMDSMPMPQRDDTLARLMAKAHRWLRDMEAGRIGSIRTLAERENLDDSYVAKVLRLTLLAPDIVKVILDGNQPDVMTWRELAKPFPAEWAQQREQWGIATPV
ncbi:MAG: hypothetical protein HQL63_14595 [Magnetococcales bacterium]|nr:hypothetical protein [Magnetococcales bacterium]